MRTDALPPTIATRRSPGRACGRGHAAPRAQSRLWRGGLCTLWLALLAAACVTVPPPPEPRDLGERMVLLPVADATDAGDPAAGHTDVAALAPILEDALSACFARARTVVPPSKLREIQSRMRAEIAAERARDPEALEPRDVAILEAYAMRELLDDHPGAGIVVRPSVIQSYAPFTGWIARWHGVEREVPGAPESTWSRILSSPSGAQAQIATVSLRIGIESRRGNELDVHHAGIGLAARRNPETGLLEPADLRVADVDPELLASTIQGVLGRSCGE